MAEALWRVEPGRRLHLRMLEGALEPGVFGVVHPVLLWPAGISQRLDDAQLESVLALEVCHVRRRDNLTAVLHMLVQAAFWFHPLVWWMGARLVEERERACDEAVLLEYKRPQEYAESILKRGLIVRAKGRSFEMTVKGMSLQTFVDALLAQKETGGRPILDQTGLTDAYDFTLVWGPEETAPSDGSDVEEPSLFIAVQQQLGLKLVSTKGPGEVSGESFGPLDG